MGMISCVLSKTERNNVLFASALLEKCNNMLNYCFDYYCDAAQQKIHVVLPY